MNQPQFGLYQFVDNSSFNTAFGNMLLNDQRLASGGSFFIAGVVSPTSCVLTTTPGSLVLGVAAPLPFRVLFDSGAYTAAHGTVNGSDTNTTTVDFTSIVPSSGTRIAYLIATYVQIQQNPIVISGPPPGHPDYSSTFVPYQFYTNAIDSIQFSATLTPPDNLVTIEIGRVLLTHGATSLNPIDTEFAEEAQVVVPPVTMNGDVIETTINNFIQFLQGQLVDVSAVTAGQVFTYNGVQWQGGTPATTLPPSGPAGSDIGGTYPNHVIVTGLQGRPVSTNVPTAGQYLVWNTSSWIPTSLVLPTKLPPSGPAFGDLGGAYDAPTGPTVIKLQGVPISATVPTSGQVLAISLGGPTKTWTPTTLAPILSSLSFNGTASFPVNPLTGSAGTLLIQWGYYSPTVPPDNFAGFLGSDESYTVNWNVTFPNDCLWASASLSNKAADRSAGTVVMETVSTAFDGGVFRSDLTPGGNIGKQFNDGFYWFAIGF